jgi:hypothetical protein
MQNTSTSEVKPKLNRTTISLPSEIFSEGKRRAHADDRDFSNYIARLIKADLRTEENAEMKG